MFEALQQREQHNETSERKLTALKRRLDYEEVFRAPMNSVESPGLEPDRGSREQAPRLKDAVNAESP